MNLERIERCKGLIKLFTTRKDFREAHPKEYDYLKWNKQLHLLNDLLRVGNKMRKMVYMAKFPDGSVYIGFTDNYNRRKSEHFLEGSVFNYYQLTGDVPIFTEVSDYIDVEEASKIEIDLIASYRNLGVNVLNIRNGGECGSSEKVYTYDKCLIEASKCGSMKIFREQFKRHYVASQRYGWIVDICDIMNWGKYEPKKINYWNKVTCKSAASECSSIRDFSSKYQQAYAISKKNGWVREFFPESVTFNKLTKEEKTKEYFESIVVNYKKKIDLYRDYRKLYNHAHRNGWLGEYF